MLRPRIGEDALAYCTSRVQQSYDSVVEWFVKRKNGALVRVSTGHNHIIKENQLQNETFAFFKEKEVQLRFKYNFDFINEMFDCNHNESDGTFACTAEYKCIAEYLPLRSSSPSLASLSISYSFGKLF